MSHKLDDIKIEYKHNEVSPFFVFFGDQTVEILHQKFSILKYLKGLFSGIFKLENGYRKYYKTVLFRGLEKNIDPKEYLRKIHENPNYLKLKLNTFVGVRGEFSDEANLILGEIDINKKITQVYKCKADALYIIRGIETDISSQKINWRKTEIL